MREENERSEGGVGGSIPFAFGVVSDRGWRRTGLLAWWRERVLE